MKVIFWARGLALLFHCSRLAVHWPPMASQSLAEHVRDANSRFKT